MTGSRRVSVPLPLHRDPAAVGCQPLRLLTSCAGEHTLIRLAGEIDVTTVEIVTAAASRCLQDHPASLDMDLRSVTFCDCAGVRGLRQVLRDGAAAGTLVRITAPGPQVRRVFTLAGAAGLLTAPGPRDPPPGEEGAGPADRRTNATGSGTVPQARAGAAPEPDAAFLVPPAPPPDAVAGARRDLNQRYATGLERLLWELDKQPMADLDAVRALIAAPGQGEGVAAALMLVQAARLGLDRDEAAVFDAASAAGLTDDAIAAALGLSGATAAAARRQWLATRRTFPYEEPDPRHRRAPGSLAQAAGQAGRRVRHAAGRVAQITQRLEGLSTPSTAIPDADAAGQSVANAAEARMPAQDAADRTALGLLRAAEAQEQCAAGYAELAGISREHRDEYSAHAAWHWRTALEYRQLARRYRGRGPATG